MLYTCEIDDSGSSLYTTSTMRLNPSADSINSLYIPEQRSLERRSTFDSKNIPLFYFEILFLLESERLSWNAHQRFTALEYYSWSPLLSVHGTDLVSHVNRVRESLEFSSGPITIEILGNWVLENLSRGRVKATDWKFKEGCSPDTMGKEWD